MTSEPMTFSSLLMWCSMVDSTVVVSCGLSKDGTQIRRMKDGGNQALWGCQTTSGRRKETEARGQREEGKGENPEEKKPDVGEKCML